MYKILAIFKGKYKRHYPHFTGGKMRVRVRKQFAPSQTASKWLSWGSNSGLLTTYRIFHTQDLGLLSEISSSKNSSLKKALTRPSLLLIYSICNTLNCNIFVYTFSSAPRSSLEKETTSYSFLRIIRTYLVQSLICMLIK